MSEVGNADSEKRRKQAQARLEASRPMREAAAAAHARAMEDRRKSSLDALRANPFRMTEEERARILAMTDEEIEAAALAAPDNPPWTDEELAQALRERDERRAAAKRSA